ncbi:MAG: hypothetical protein ACRDJW_22825 [Thermomicrobiales bacterium]
MGSTIVDRLPKSQRWQVVVGLLNMPHLDARAVGGASCLAAQRRLNQLRSDPSLGYCFWLLVRLAAARGDNFAGEVAQLGIPARRDDAALQFVARVADHTRVELNRYPQSGPFGEIAALALRAALRETVGTEGRSLFGSPLEDVERAFRRHSSEAQFGDLARRFFADFTARTLRFYVDRELAHAVGGGGLATARETGEFSAALDLHARQTAKVVELYAARWYAKKHWERLGAIEIDDTQAFVAHALDKLQASLKREVSP